MSAISTNHGDLAPPLPAPPALQHWLTERVASYLQVDPQHIPPDTPLAEIGLDSVYALSLCGDIEDAFHLVVEPTLAWDYPTISAIALFLTACVTTTCTPNTRGPLDE
jgi:acyl carrier protein